MSGRPGPNVIRTCILCGEQFNPKSTRQKCCNKPIRVPCVICGKPMEQICTTKSQPKTCSKECTIKLGDIGRENAAHKLLRTCKYCGKEFIPQSSRDEYCNGPHYATCEVCGKQFLVTGRYNHINKTCSDACSYISAKRNTDMPTMVQHLKETLLEKYGVENSSQIPGVLDKAKQTSLERYGVEYYTQTQEYKDRVKDTDLKKYGSEHHLSSPEVIEKRRQTVATKYGVDNVFQADSIKAKVQQTCVDRYGVPFVTQNSDISERIKQTNISKYGVEHAMMLPEYQEKARQTNIQKYGLSAPTQSHIKDIVAWYSFIDNPRVYIMEHYSESPRTEQLALDLGVDRSTVDDYLHRFDATDCVRRAKSLMEEEILAFIKQQLPECRVITNNHTVLFGKELDIYLPDYQFAIECNPTVTHNSSVGDPWGGEKKSINYHKHKTDLCSAQGIFLMHIFGYEWTHHKEIIKSMISNVLGCNQRIYARKCRVVEVDTAKAMQFLQQNHRQGYASTKLHLGLEYQGQLVSIMSFGKMRSTIGIDSSDLSECWELVRFCNILNVSVIGGASKLFSYFVKNYAPTQIRSFSDRSHTRGNLYELLSFKEIRQSGANYVWVNTVDDKAYHRTNAQKRHIRRFLKDDNIDLTQSERQIMINHGYVQVYDSGTIIWHYGG